MFSDDVIEFSLENYPQNGTWTQVFNVSGRFLGITKIFAEIKKDKVNRV